MQTTTLLAWVRAWDGTREVWPSNRYLTALDMSPDQATLTGARLNRLVEQVAAADQVHTDWTRYELELIDFHTGQTLFHWLYVPRER